MLLALLGAWVYLNRVGLPDFLKRPLLEGLRARGVELDFSRLRLSWYRGILAENVTFGQANTPLSPRAAFGQVQLRLNHHALARRQIQIDALILRQGRLVWPISQTNRVPRQLTLDNIRTDLRFLPNDEWTLDNFNAGFLGGRVQVSGTLANASAARNWKFLRPQPELQEQAAQQWQTRLRQLADALDDTHFAAPPDLRLDVRGDARDLRSFGIHLLASVPAARTPWGALAQGQFDTRLLPATSNQLSRAELNLVAASAQTRWGNLTNFHLLIQLPLIEGQTNLLNGSLTGARPLPAASNQLWRAELNLVAASAQTRWAAAANLHLEMALVPAKDQPGQLGGDLVLTANRLRSRWGSGSKARLTGQWVHALTNPIPVSAQGRFECEPLETQWGRAAQAQVRARFALNPQALAQPGPATQSSPVSTHADWAWWARLEPYSLDWECHLADFRAKELAAQQIACAGAWRAPALILTNLHATFTHGQVGLGAALNVATRAVQAQVTSDADLRQLVSLMPEGAAQWAAQVAWNQPPSLSANVELVLPAWTNREPDWRAEIQPTLRVDGQFQAGRGGAFKGVFVSSAQSHFSCSNQCWRLPDLLITRPEGQLIASYSEDPLTKQIYCRVASNIDPRAARPLLGPDEQAGLDIFTFTQPPSIEAEVRGLRGDPKQLGIQGRVTLTNFTFRGESASSLQTGVLYSNKVLQLLAARLLRNGRQLNADNLIADFNVQKIYLTNGFSTTDPMVVARAIGPPTARAIEPFHFITHPTVRVHGIIPMHGEKDADLYFQVQAGAFHWLTFNVPQVAADLHWLGLNLFVTNVQMDFYGGKAEGSASFHFDPSHPGTDYQFTLSATNALLQSLMADLFTRTNSLEGRLAGTLVITRANSEDWRQTQGYGALQLRDGLLWDIPLFGVFSPALDALVPGLGSSRATWGASRFAITNGVIHSDNLEIHSRLVRLLYRGNADLQGRLNAHVEAKPLRDVPLFGPLFNTPLWPVTRLFEYKVTGSLDQPKAEPSYLLPRIFGLPFHPWRTLKGLLSEEPALSRTNAPPSIKR
ncbi:MAG: AsmA-like C-terminal region-containing protein [Limisphaerales bacterium]